ALKNPNGVEFVVDDIEIDEPRLDEPRFILSYVTLNPGDIFDKYSRTVAHTYDNALAMLAFMARGTNDDWRRAKLLGDAFVYALNHDPDYSDDRLRNAYEAGDLMLPSGWRSPRGLTGAVRLPGTWDCDTEMWQQDSYQVSAYTGNMAWAMIALLTYNE